jgi:hypothetical protein
MIARLVGPPRQRDRRRRRARPAGCRITAADPGYAQDDRESTASCSTASPATLLDQYRRRVDGPPGGAAQAARRDARERPADGRGDAARASQVSRRRRRADSPRELKRLLESGANPRITQGAGSEAEGPASITDLIGKPSSGVDELRQMLGDPEAVRAVKRFRDETNGTYSATTSGTTTSMTIAAAGAGCTSTSTATPASSSTRRWATTPA